MEDAPVRSQLRRPPPGAITGAGSGILAPGILILAPGASLRLLMDRQRARGGLNDAGAGAGASLGPPAQVSSMAWREQASSQLRCNGGSARYTAMCEGGKWYEMMKRT